jgi:hypothetical protein
MFETIQQSVDKLHDTFERTDLEVEWKKIQTKMEEARYNPGALKPLVDCIFSLLLAARSRGYNVQAVFESLEALAAKNLSRKWKKMPDGTYQAT